MTTRRLLSLVLEQKEIGSAENWYSYEIEQNLQDAMKMGLTTAGKSLQKVVLRCLRASVGV